MRQAQKSGKYLFKGKLISLVKRKALLPNGFAAALEVVIHPGASLVIPFLSKDKIILLRQLRPVINKYLYELPAGTLKKNEPELTCAKREIREETGFSAKKFARLGYIYPVPGYSTEKIIIFKAKGLVKKSLSRDKDEIMSILTVNKAKIKSLFKKGKIIDAKTICALAMLGWL